MEDIYVSTNILKVFGFNEFREGQEEVVKNILSKEILLQSCQRVQVSLYVIKYRHLSLKE